MLSIGRDNLQFYPNFALFSTLGGMNIDHDFVQVSKLSEDQKKRSSPKVEHFFPQIQVKTKKKDLHHKWNTFFLNSGEDQKKRSSSIMEHVFSPNSSGHLRSDPHQSHIIGGDADVDHTQTIGGRLFGGIYPPIPPGFRHSCKLDICTFKLLI